MKPKLLYVGLSVLIIGIIFTAFGYSEFSRISSAKQAIEPLLELYETHFPSQYQQFLQQNTAYQQLLSDYNKNLIVLIGGVALLLVGLGITIYGATKKAILPTSTTETPTV